MGTSVRERSRRRRSHSGGQSGGGCPPFSGEAAGFWEQNPGVSMGNSPENGRPLRAEGSRGHGPLHEEEAGVQERRLEGVISRAAVEDPYLFGELPDFVHRRLSGSPRDSPAPPPPRRAKGPQAGGRGSRGRLVWARGGFPAAARSHQQRQTDSAGGCRISQ